MILTKEQTDKIMWKLNHGELLWAHERAYLQETLDHLFYTVEHQLEAREGY